jgi:4-hydroxybutyryl-CoA dehydratase/vinylacetyl-CoA-Delta-isomerase
LVCATYELAGKPKYDQLLTATSHLAGNKINRFCHVHQSVDDLVKKSKMCRTLGAYTGSCFQRCVGMDSLNALSMVTFETDRKHGTEYNTRFLKYLRYVQDEDLVCCGAMTDAKADRSLRPADQPDPNQHLHVVEERQDGIVVRGAKLHQSGAVNSHEIIVMPTREMREEDKDYAISFGLPTDTKGIPYVYGRQSSDTRKMEGGTIDTGNILYSGQESMVVFEDVFVPWDLIFMYREREFLWSIVSGYSGLLRILPWERERCAI